jgi:hypothetical protein
MSLFGKDRFEVQTEVNGRSNIDGVFDTEAMAMERAQDLLAQARFSAVRVVKLSRWGSEEPLFEKLYRGGGKVTTISHIDDSNVCTDVLQVFSFESRMTLLRLFRKYCDDQSVIPAEQLHQYFPLRYFEREAMLFNSGLNRLAALQAPKMGLKPTDRMDQLIRMFGKLKEMAQAGDALAPFDQILPTRGLSALLTEIKDKRPPEEADRIVTHAYASYLEEQRDWPQKIAAIVRTFEHGAPESERVVDELLAEAIDGRAPVRALIGYAPDLGSALLSLLATGRGELDDRLPMTEPLMAVNNIVGRTMKNVQAALLRRIIGGVEGNHPLTRVGGDGERRMFQTLLDRLAALDGYLGGPDMASALSRRAKTTFRSNSGQDLSFEETVRRLQSALPGPAARIGYLLDLAASEFGQRKLSYLVAEVSNIFQNAHMRDLAPVGMTVREAREGLGNRLRRAGIPRALADALIARMEQLPDDEAARASSLLAPDEAGTLDLSSRTGPGWMRLVLVCNDHTYIVPDDGPQMMVGRGSACQIQAANITASRQHATLLFTGSGFTISDSSTNGTVVAADGQEPRALAKGDSMSLEGRGTIFIGTAQGIDQPTRISFEVKPAG